MSGLFSQSSKKPVKGSGTPWLTILPRKERFSSKVAQLRPKLAVILDFPEPYDFSRTIVPLIESLSDYFHELPASQENYYAKAGGMMEYAMTRAYLASAQARAYLMPQESSLQNLTPEISRWLYVVFSASLLHRVTHQLFHFEVERETSEGVYPWQPLLGPLEGQRYRYDYRQPPNLSFSQQLTVWLAQKIMPRAGLSWLLESEEVFAVWLALLNEDWEHLGWLSLVLPHADASAVLYGFRDPDLGGGEVFLDLDLEKLDVEALLKSQREAWLQVHQGRCDQDTWRLGGFIGRVSMDEGNDRYAHAAERIAAKEGADRHGVGESKKESTRVGHFAGQSEAIKAAAQFVDWLRRQAASGHLTVNGAHSPFHMTANGLVLVYPLVLAQYLKQHPHAAGPEQVLRGMKKLGILSHGQVNVRLGQGAQQTVRRAIVLDSPFYVLSSARLPSGPSQWLQFSQSMRASQTLHLPKPVSNANLSFEQQAKG